MTKISVRRHVLSVFPTCCTISQLTLFKHSTTTQSCFAKTLAECDTCSTDQKHFPHMPDALLCFLKGATRGQAQMQMSKASLWNLSAHQSETKCLGLWLKMWWSWEAAVTFQRKRRRTRHQMLTGGVRLLLSVQKEKLWGHLSWSDTTVFFPRLLKSVSLYKVYNFFPLSIRFCLKLMFKCEQTLFKWLKSQYVGNGQNYIITRL